jgi:hypothetical protein
VPDSERCSGTEHGTRNRSAHIFEGILPDHSFLEQHREEQDGCSSQRRGSSEEPLTLGSSDALRGRAADANPNAFVGAVGAAQIIRHA